MKFFKSLSIFLLSLATLMSCSTVNNLPQRLGDKIRPLTSSGKTTDKAVDKTPGNHADKTPGKTTDNRRRGKQSQAAAASQPAVGDSVATYIAPLQYDALEKLQGEWLITSLMDVTTGGADCQPTLIIDAQAGKFYLADCCNYLTGDVATRGNADIKFDTTASTTAYCEGNAWSGLAATVLSQATSFAVTTSSGATTTLTSLGATATLTLTGSRGTLMTAVRTQALDRLNGMWEVAALGGRELTAPRPTLVIDLPQRHIHGDSGCNIFTGDIIVGESSLQFVGMAVTARHCDNEDTERRLLIALELTENARVDGDRATLLNAQGDPTVTLVRPR